MLRKIIFIKNIGRFLNSAAAGDVEFKRHTLLFAENARGKTTLCAILRSLQSGNPGYVIGRTTLRTTATPQVSILIDSRTVTFGGGAWSATEPSITIFDSTFVSENIYSGDAVDLYHRRNLYNVIVGQEGVRLAKRIEQFDTASRDKSTEIREKRAAVQRLVPQPLTVETFLNLAEDPTIDHKISEKEKELEAVKQADQIRAHVALQDMSLPSFPRDFEALLSKSIDGIAEDASELVAKQIQKHEMHMRGESWLSEGLTYIRDQACPFCGQSIDRSTLIAAYRTYFSQAYHALRTEISAMRQSIGTTFSDREIAQVERSIDQNNAASDFWSQYCDITPPIVENRPRLAETLRSVREAAFALLDSKLASPLDTIPTGTAFADAITAFADLQTIFATYNRSVQAANAVVAAKKLSTSRTNLASVENTLTGLRAVKKRDDPEARAACEQYRTALEQKESLENQKGTAKGVLDAYARDLMARFEGAINRHLDDFQVGFRITGTKHAYPGGVASSTYQILINDAAVELGDSNSPINRPSFKNTLSSGDRNTLALAYFLAQLEHDPSLAQKIVVFDDPFNSQDRFRKQRTIQKIKQCGDSCQQLIVLSHERDFLKLLWDRLATEPSHRKCLQLARIGVRDTRISAFDIDQATLSQFETERKALADFYNSGQGAPMEIVRMIRPVLEAYCRNLYPGDFGSDTLGTIIGKIRDHGAAPQLSPLLNDLDALNEYTCRYHHGEGLNDSNEAIDGDELQGFVKATLAIVGGG